MAQHLSELLERKTWAGWGWGVGTLDWTVLGWNPVSSIGEVWAGGK